MKRVFVISVIVLLVNLVHGQPLTGIKTIPGDYATIQAAISALNTNGVGAGGVTFNVAAGSTETLSGPAAGLISYTCLPANYSSAASPVIFQKSGSGANPLVTAFTPGTSTTTDGMIMIAGADYITFDGISLQENVLNTTATQQMEWGFALVKKSSSAPIDGCQNVTIKNCTVTLSKANTGSTGIHAGSHLYNSTGMINGYATADASNNCKIYGNSISNVYYGIDFEGFSGFNDQNNEIGVTAGNTITNFGGGAGNPSAIYASCQDNFKIAANVINGGNGTTGNLYGIYTGTGFGSNAQIYGNTITLTPGPVWVTTMYGIRNLMGDNGAANTVSIYNNIIENFTAPSAASWPSYLISQESNAKTVNVYGNIMQNNAHYGGNYYYAIGEYSSAVNGIRNIYNNVVSNLTIATSTTIETIYYHVSSTTTGNIYNNTIHGLYSNGGSNKGILMDAGGTTNVYRNRIYDISTDGNGFSGQGLLTGIYSKAATTANIYNNFVTDLKAPTTGYGYSADAIEGIYVNTGTTCNIVNNTVYLNASSIYTSFRTACVFISNNGISSVLLKNNILVNLSTSTGAGNFAVALRKATTSLTNYSLTSDNNLFYAGIPGPNNLIFEDYTNADQTLAAFQARVSPREASSIAEMPPFVNAAGYDFHLVAGAGTACESGGQVVSSPFAVTDDYDGDARFPNAGYPNSVIHPATAPDIGADEFAGTGDNTPPNIAYTPLVDPTDNNPRTLTAMIYDAGLAVPVSGAGLPMLYWKKTGDVSYTGVQGVSIGGGLYTFAFGGGVGSGNVVSYYIAAQDVIVPPNVGVYPSAGAAGFSANPPAVSTPPSNPSTYTVQSPLVGVWTIPGGFPTIQAAIATLSFRGVGPGGVIFNVAANYTETFTNSNGGLINYTCAPSNYSSATNTVVFQKSGAGANPVVTAFTPGTSASVDGIIKITGGDYITFDGISLQENPLNTTPVMQMEWGYALLKKNSSATPDGCQNVVIKNCGITLNKSNTASVGVYIADHTASSTSLLGLSNGPVDANNNCKVFGNTISNAYIGISLVGFANSSSSYDTGNEIGATAANTITNFGGAATDAGAIFVNYENNVKISNNLISGGDGTTASHLYGIYVLNESGCNFDITGNTISLNSPTQHNWIHGILISSGTSPNVININNNTIENISNPSSIDSYIYGIYQAATGNTINLNGNIVRNIAKPGSGYLEGIVASYGATNNVQSISNNQVYNLTSTGSTAVYGIESSIGTTGSVNIAGNVIHGLSSSGFRNIGIYNTFASTINLSRNRVYDITGNGGMVYGCYFTSIATANVYNNFISDLKTPSANSGISISGLHFQDGTTINLFNNTVYLNASSSFLNFSSACVYVASNSSSITSKNNIMVNMSVSSGSGHYAIAFFRNGSSLASYDPGSGNNLFYAGLPGPNNILFSDNSTQYQTIAAFQTAVAPREANSATELPPFVNAAANNLQIQGDVETHCESGGQVISAPFAVNDDFEGDARYPNAGYPANPLDAPNAPDMGADEFGGGKYHTPPAISYTPLANPVTTAAQVLTATITDPSSGVPTSGSGLPVLYWKINNAPAYTPVQATSLGGSQYSFTFGSGVVSADIVYYYIVAQGNWPIPNIGAYPSALASGFSANPPAVSVPPANPGSYIVQSPLYGTVTVNSAGKYPSLTGSSGLFQNINTCGLQGNLTAIVSTDLVEPGTYQLNTWAETGAGNYSLTIQPDGTTQRIISGTAVTASTPMVNINGADRITIDGGSGKYLLFRNTSSSAWTTGPTIQFNNGALNDSIKNCIIENNGTTTTSGAVTIGSTGTNNVYISGCDIHNATAGTTGPTCNGIYSNSASNTVNLQANNIFNWTSSAICLNNVGNGCTISDNNLYETAAQTGTLYGIYINAGSGHTISGNNFGGSDATRTGAALRTSAGVYGMYLSVGTASPTSVQGNTLSNFGSTGSGSSSAVYGIYLNAGNINVGTITGNVLGGGTLPSDTIRTGYDNGIIWCASPGTINIENNYIGNISYWGGGNDRTAGMYIMAGTVHVKNNYVMDIKSNSSGTGFSFLPEGIHLNSSGALSNPVVEYNTISNIWNFNTGASAFAVAGINIQTSSVSNAIVRNNNVSNIYAMTGGTGASAPQLIGIYNFGTGTSVYNNMISLGQSPAAPESRIYGIFDGSTMANSYYFNSVSINGTASGTNATYAFYTGSTGTITAKDNIFYNERTGGSIKPYAIGTGSSVSLTSNYNDLFSTATPLGIWGSTSCANLAAWRTASSQDANSISANPNFVATNNLHINSGSGSPVSDAGLTISGITNDYDNEIRNSPPEIGADDYTLPSTVNTLAPTLVTCTSATLHGTVNANNQVVTASFEYGTTTSYGNTVTALPSTITGNTATAVTTAISALAPSTQYHYRTVGMVGIVPFYGPDVDFTTGAVCAAAGAISGPVNVCKGSFAIYTVPPIANAATYIWNVPFGANITVGTGSNSVTVYFTNSSVSGNITVTGSNSCGTGPSSSIFVTVNPLPVPVVSGPVSPCLNSTGNVYSTVAGMTGYTWNVSAGGTVTSGGTATNNTVTVTWGAIGSGSVSVSYTDANGCHALTPTVYNINVNQLPVPTLSGQSAACVGSTGNSYSTQPGMTGYTWSVSPGGTITAGGSATNSAVTITWNTAGPQTVSVNYTDANGCTAASPAVYNVTVNPLPVPAITGPVSACVGATGNVYSTAAGMTGYSWSVSPGGTITAGGTAMNSSATITWNTPGPQTVSVNYTDANGCTATTATVKNVTVNALPMPAITGAGSACAGATGMTYATETGMTAYNWTISPGGTIVSGSGTNPVIVNWNTAGVQTLSVNYNNGAGCQAATATVKNVAVNTLPVPGITGNGTACTGSTGITYTTEAGMTSYAWTISSGGSITSGTGTNSVTVTWNTNGVQTISVNYINGSGCTATSPTVKNVTVNSVLTPTITGPASACAGATGVSYTTETGMTSYSWTISAGGTIVSGTGTNSILVNWNTVGAQSVTVNYNNTFGCAAGSPTTYYVTVNALPAPTITGAGSACVGSTGVTYSTESGKSAYSWTISAGGTITSGEGTSAVTVSWNTAGAQTISVNYNNAAGCSAASATVRNVTVNALPVPTISGSVSLCAGAAGMVYTTEAGMTAYSWNVSPGGTVTSGGTSSGNAVTVTWNTAGAQTVNVNYTNGNGCTATVPATYNVTVNALPTPAVSGPVSACAGSAGNVYSTQAGMTAYSWNVSAGGVISAGGTSTSNSVTVTWNSAGPQTVSVNYNNGGGCAAASPVIYNVTVNALPVPSVSGPSTACVNSAGNVYTTQAGMSGYAWTVSAGGTITAGGTSSGNSVTVTWNATGAQTVSVNYMNGSGCTAASPATYPVTVNALPVPVISGPAAACISSTGNVYTTQAGMTGYSWSVSAGGLITAGGTAASNTATITWTNSGPQTVSVNYNNGNGCTAASAASYAVTVSALPVPTITGPATACANSTGNSYTTQAGMTGYTWNVSAGGTVTAGTGTNAITVTWNTAGPQTVSVNYNNGSGCTAASASVQNVTVNARPVPVITGPANVCAGSAGNTYSTQAGMTGYSWTVSAGGIITAGGTSSSNSVTVTWNATGAQTVSVNYSNGSGCAAISPVSYSVTVSPLPVPAVTGPGIACIGSAGNVYTTQPGMTGYSWTISPGGTITAGGTSTSNTATVTWNGAGPQAVGVNYTNGNSCTATSPASYSVTVNTLPVPTISGPAAACTNSTGNTYTTQAGMTGYNWGISAGGSITAGGGTNTITVSWNNTGVQTVSVNYTNGGGCTAASASVYNITVNPRPVPVIAGPANVCAGTSGNTYTTAAGMTGYSWTISAGGTITAGAGTNTITVTWNTAGSQNVSVNYSNTSGCSATTPSVYPVVVNPFIVPVISGPSAVCAVSTGNVYTTDAGMTNYNWTVSAGGTITAGAGTNSITVTWSTVGAQTVSVLYSVPSGCSPATPTLYNVAVNLMPEPTITGSNNLCQNSGIYAYTTETGMNNYQWSVSPGGTILSGAGTSQVQVSWNSAGAQWIAVNYSNASGCSGTNPSQLNVTVSPLPDPAGNITGTSSVCAGAMGIQYSIAPVANALTYIWQLPAGATIMSGSGTNSIIVNFAGNASPGSITVYGNNQCGNGSASPAYMVSVNPIPAAPVVSANGPILTSSAPSGNQWYFEGTLIPGAAGQVYQATQTGWYWATVNVSGCVSDTSGHRYVLMVGQQEHGKAEFSVYPVPCDGKFTVSMTTPMQEHVSIQVYTGIGVSVYEAKNIPVNGRVDKEIDLGPAPDGLYTVVIRSGNYRTVKKVLVHK